MLDGYLVLHLVNEYMASVPSIRLSLVCSEFFPLIKMEDVVVKRAVFRFLSSHCKKSKIRRKRVTFLPCRRPRNEETEILLF